MCVWWLLKSVDCVSGITWKEVIRGKGSSKLTRVVVERVDDYKSGRMLVSRLGSV